MYFKYFIVCCLIALTGSSFASAAPPIVYLGLMSVLLISFFYSVNYGAAKPNINVIIKQMLIVFPFIFLFLLQYLKRPEIGFDLFFTQSIKIIVLFVISFFAMRIVKRDFIKIFVSIVYFLAIVSLFLYPTQFFPEIELVIKDSVGSLIAPLGYQGSNVPPEYISKTLIVFTYHHLYGHGFEGLPRNCGAFWEPGVFGVFLVLSLIFNVLVLGSKIFSKKNIIFLVCILTTFSTSAIIVTIIFYLYFIFSNDLLPRKARFIVFILFLIIANILFWNLDFLGGKVSELWFSADTNRNSRFGAVLYHLDLVKNDLFFGYGLKYLFDQSSLEFDYLNSSPNGISIILMYFGIFGFLFYFWLLYKGISNIIKISNFYSLQFSIIIFSLICFLIFSQILSLKLLYFYFISFSSARIQSSYKFQNSHLLTYSNV